VQKETKVDHGEKIMTFLPVLSLKKKE